MASSGFMESIGMRNSAEAERRRCLQSIKGICDSLLSSSKTNPLHEEFLYKEMKNIMGNLESIKRREMMKP